MGLTELQHVSMVLGLWKTSEGGVNVSDSLGLEKRGQWITLLETQHITCHEVWTGHSQGLCFVLFGIRIP